MSGCGGDDGKAVSWSDYRRVLVADHVLFRICATPAELRKVGDEVLSPTGPERAIRVPHWSLDKATREVVAYGRKYRDIDYRVGEGNERHPVGDLLDDIVKHLKRCRPAAAAQLQANLKR